MTVVWTTWGWKPKMSPLLRVCLALACGVSLQRLSFLGFWSKAIQNIVVTEGKGAPISLTPPPGKGRALCNPNIEEKRRPLC